MMRSVVFVVLCFVLVQAVRIIKDDPIINLRDIASDVVASMNRSVDPCQDFYTYSCGGWIAKTTLPADKGAIFKSFSIIGDNNNAILKNILEKGEVDDVRVVDFYRSCLNISEIDAIGVAPLRALFPIVTDVRDNTTFLLSVGRLQAIGVSALINFGAALDSKNPNMTIAQFSQGGLVLPYPELYEDDDLIEKYSKHISTMFSLVGFNDAPARAKAIIAFESGIANFTIPMDELTDPFVTYNKIDLSGLMKIAPLIDWKAFFVGMGYPNITQINVDAPSFYAKLAKFVSAQNVFSWHSYLYWQLIHHFAPHLNSPLVKENFAFFGAILSGAKEPSPRWETCMNIVDEYMGFLLGRYFVDAAFPGASKQLASQMVHDIEGAMHTNLETITWMGNATRENALTKLGLVSNQIGFPQNQIKYEGLRITRNEYFQNILNAIRWNFRFMADQIEKPTDKDLWEMTPDQVNAYYEPTKNQMVFPAGILQSTFFNLTYPEPMNYGGAGFIMGHELTHGFDNMGKDYDGYGYLRDWWEPISKQRFNELTECVINQYSKFEVLPGLFVNGNQTLGENIADMGGGKNSYMALRSRIGDEKLAAPSIVNGLSNAQLFFVAYAQGWCAVTSPEYLKLRVNTDVHSPPKPRVMGPLINHPYFASTFSCPSGSPMNPTKKCAVW